MSSEAKNIVVSKVDRFLQTVETKINEAIVKKKSLPTTALAKEVAPSVGWEYLQGYHVIDIYLGEREELFIKKGPNGGITLRDGWCWVDGAAKKVLDTEGGTG